MTTSLKRRTALAAALSLGLLISPPAASALVDDPNLDQTIEENQPIVTGPRVLSAGHVDMGPRFDEGRWTLLVHDDVARADADARSVWRYPGQTVFQVLDQAILTVPDDPAYAFIGAAPGTPVHVVPQTQHPDVVWLGWNTQDPDVMASIDRGVTMTLEGVQGPGDVIVYLQSGTFGEPQRLWDSRVNEPQPIWVDVNTHTHANWVFTVPGVYLLRLTVAADLLGGSSVSDTQLLRFAVGTGTDPAAAFVASWEGADADPTAVPTEPSDAEVPDAATHDPLVPILIGAIIVVAAGLIVALTVAVVRGNRAKRRVLAGRAGSGDDGDEGAPL